MRRVPPWSPKAHEEGRREKKRGRERAEIEDREKQGQRNKVEENDSE